MVLAKKKKLLRTLDDHSIKNKTSINNKLLRGKKGKGSRQSSLRLVTARTLRFQPPTPPLSIPGIANKKQAWTECILVLFLYLTGRSHLYQAGFTCNRGEGVTYSRIKRNGMEGGVKTKTLKTMHRQTHVHVRGHTGVIQQVNLYMQVRQSSCNAITSILYIST